MADRYMIRFLDLSFDMWEAHRNATGQLLSDLRDNVDFLNSELFQAKQDLKSSDIENRTVSKQNEVATTATALCPAGSPSST